MTIPVVLVVLLIGIVIGAALGAKIVTSNVAKRIRGAVSVYHIPEDNEQYMVLEIYADKAPLLQKDNTLFEIRRR